MTVTVALPVRDGARDLDAVLAAVRAQRLDRDVEVLVVDSGSRDGSRAIARRRGARVIEIAPEEFSHGETRNLLMREAAGEHVAFLTQDAVPAADDWLATLLAGFDLAPGVALVCGPYLPRRDASTMVRRELETYFRGMAPDGRPRVARLARAGERPPQVRPPGVPVAVEDPLSPGPETFVSDANACLARTAWEEIPFRPVRYAEDRLLAAEQLAAGRAKVFDPGAAVVHSHDYPPLARFRRFFDEWRGLRETLGHVQPAGPRTLAAGIRGGVGADVRFARRDGVHGRLARVGGASVSFHVARAAGATLGSRADRIPPPLRRICSLERRDGFEPRPLPFGDRVDRRSD